MSAAWTMAPNVDTMSLPCAQTSLIDDSAATAAEQENRAGGAASMASSASTAAASAAVTSSTATATYATPTRQAGLAAVTPSSTLKAQGTPPHQRGGGAGIPPGGAARDEGLGEAVVSASSAEELEGCAAAAGDRDIRADFAPPLPAAPAPAAHPTLASASAAATEKIHEAARSVAPSIQLGPRVSPAARKNHLLSPHAAKRGDSPAAPRSLGGALAKKGRDTLSSLFQHGGASSHQEAAAKQECPSTPAAQGGHHFPAPSSFLAAKISPLRSSAMRSGGSGNSSKALMPLPREKTPPPQTDSVDEGFKMFLSPRTPKPITHSDKGAKSSGLTPRFTPGLTPTNFASDFGKGHNREGSISALDASNVFAWLDTPTASGLFSPNGLNSLSAANTPRGMYGFSGPPSKTLAGQGLGHTPFNPPKLAPSPSKSNPFFSELEHGGDAGVNTPKIPESHRSMICISPLASKRSGKKKIGAVAEEAPETPMSINFSEVFASPARLPTPRLIRTASAPLGAAAKREECTSSDGLASPVASALHTAERDINLDDDLNALLQLAETTTPGGRPMTFMSPLLTNSLRRSAANGGPHQYNSELVRNGSAPPSSLQLPIISSSPTRDTGSPQKKLARKGSSSSSGNMSSPHLAIRSSLDSTSLPLKSSLKTNSKKRKSPTPTNPGSPDQHQQHPGYPPHAGMTYYRHPHAAPPVTAPPGAHGYYHHPTFPSHPAAASCHGHSYPLAYTPASHPAPQQHYAYEQADGAPASVTAASPAKEPSPVKPPRKSKSSRRSRSSKSRSKPPTTKPEAPLPTPVPTSKRARKSSSKAPSKKSPKNAPSNPAERKRITAAIYAVNTVYGDGCEKEEKLKAATLRGVTQRPSGKWQAQLYYAGKSRYIGVFDTKEKASLAYEIAREVLKTDKDDAGPANAEETDQNVTLARKAAFAGVSDHYA